MKATLRKPLLGITRAKPTPRELLAPLTKRLVNATQRYGRPHQAATLMTSHSVVLKKIRSNGTAAVTTPTATRTNSGCCVCFSSPSSSSALTAADVVEERRLWT
jgi:hypothetical protein